MPSNHDHPLWKLLDQMQMDIRQMAGRMTELRAQIAALKLEPTPETVCGCGDAFPSVVAMQEHAYRHHNAPLPDHWAKADVLAGDTVAA